MLRVLLANFMVQVLPILLIIAGIVLVAKGRSRTAGSDWRRHLGLTLLALPIGVVIYIIAGIAAASLRGEGHFYSVPFGGYSASDNTSIAISLLIWIGLIYLLLALLIRPAK